MVYFQCNEKIQYHNKNINIRNEKEGIVTSVEHKAKHDISLPYMLGTGEVFHL
jgi:hypothetical protein